MRAVAKHFRLCQHRAKGEEEEEEQSEYEWEGGTKKVNIFEKVVFFLKKTSRFFVLGNE